MIRTSTRVATLVLLSLPLLVLFMASILIPGSPDDVESWRDFYYSVRLKYFSAWIALSFLLAINGTVLIDMPFTHPARLSQLLLAAFGVVGASSSNPKAPRPCSSQVPWPGKPAAQQGVAADQQQFASIDLGCRLAAYSCGRVGLGQRCCWPLNADPLGRNSSCTSGESRNLSRNWSREPLASA